jgi:molecular chaperone DnaK
LIDLGIDLGTTFSLASYVTSQGVSALVPDSHEPTEFSTPSVVHIGSQDALVGNTIEQMLLDEPALSVARFFKLRLGEREVAYRDAQQRGWQPESLSALVLRKLLHDSRSALSEDVGSTVIAVPAGFGDAQRRATRAAAVLAGISDVQLIEEPVAAAFYYGLTDAARDQTLLVYDFGGGTFDATLLQASPTGVYAVATDGAPVGGKNIDEALVDLIAAEYRQQYRVTPFEDPAAASQVLRFARETKLALGKPGASQVRRTLLLAGRTLEFVITRAQFDRLVMPLVEQTLAAVERTLSAGGLGWPLVDRVLLTGGSSLLPLVSEQMRRRSGKPGDAVICRQPHQAVAFGAGILAGRRRREAAGESAPVIQPVSSFDLGLRVRDKQTDKPGFHVLIPRNSPLPARNVAMFYTTREDQQRMIVEVVQRKESTGPVRSLGYFAFGPIARPRKNYPIEISLAYDVEGVVGVGARDGQTNKQVAQVMTVDEGALDRVLLEQSAWIQGLRINGL